MYIYILYVLQTGRIYRSFARIVVHTVWDSPYAPGDRCTNRRAYIVSVRDRECALRWGSEASAGSRFPKGKSEISAK